LCITSWLVGNRATRSSSSSKRWSRSAAGAASTARPHSTASLPEIESPVSSRRLALAGPTLPAHSAVVGTPQTRAGGYPIFASSSTTSRSEQRAMSVPPATQNPCTLQTTGFSEWNRLMNPRTFRHIIWKSTIGSQTRSGSWLAA
jgi:hypothetical protein